MKILTRKATSTYLALSRESFYVGAIPWSFLISRLLFIAKNGMKDDPSVEYARRILHLEELGMNDEWPYGDVEPEADNNHGEGSYILISQQDDEEILTIHFSLNVKGLREWFFRPGDPDYFPSIPHGHWNNKDFPKLDAYLGWVYDCFGAQIRRESRSSIITLWNDRKFRIEAAKAVGYYLQTYPTYSGWRVANPLILPKRQSRL